MTRVKGWTSLLSTYVVVGTTAKTLNELLDTIGPFDYGNTGIDVPTADGVEDTFTGNLFTQGSAPSNVNSDYTVRITPGSVIMAFSGTAWSESVSDDGSGVLGGDGTPAAVGTIDYDTGEWSITFDTNLPPADAEFDLTVTANYQFALGEINGLWMTPAGDMYGSFDGVNEPDQANSRGILISESMMISGQAGLISNMQLQASADTELWVELLV
jgi:hypothetical protein